MVILAGVGGASQGEQAITHSSAELEAYEWFAANVDPGSLVLTDPRFGNRLPAFAPVRVLYGHPFETPDAEYWREEVLSLLDWTAAEDEALKLLERYGVEWTLVEASAADRAPTWVDDLANVERFEDLMISRVEGR